MMRLFAAVAVAAVTLAGCAHAPPKSSTVEMEPMVFAAKPTGEVELIDAASVFERAGAAYRDGKFADAVALFDRVAGEYAGSRYVVPALYNAGLSLEALHDVDGAVARYKRITIEHAEDKDVLDAWYRMGFVWSESKNFAAAAEVYAQILQRKDLSLPDRIEAMARRGVAQFSQKDLVAAEHTFRDTLAWYHAHETEERLDNDFFLAEAAYYLGQVAHEQYRALPVRLPEKQLARDLEAKARLLLVAQARFIDAMKVDHVEWATAAGFQIGELYREFYDDIVGAPVPPALKGEARDVYIDEVKKQVRTLLQKAINIHEKNVLMAERLGEDNEWVRRSNAQMEQLRKLLVPGPTPPPEPEIAPAKPVAQPPLPKPRDEVKPRVVL
jgi:tetratricopeptide (TPR) repeat protein